jgi:hypothetical protein
MRGPVLAEVVSANNQGGFMIADQIAYSINAVCEITNTGPDENLRGHRFVP